MKSKRALELEKAKEKVKRLKAKIKHEEQRIATYAREELRYHLRHHFGNVARVAYFGINIKIMFKGDIDCALRIPPQGSHDVPWLVVDGDDCIAVYESGCFLEGDTLYDDARMLRRLAALAAFLPDAIRIVRDVLPQWRANPPDVESLMTTRVMHWITKQYGSNPLADVMKQVLIKMI
jgi:hypothetical protein